MWHQLTPFDPSFWRRHLGFHYFLKSSRNKGNKHKPECLWDAQIHKFLLFHDGNWKNYIIIAKSWFLARPAWNLVVSMTTSKMIEKQLHIEMFILFYFYFYFISFANLVLNQRTHTHTENKDINIQARTPQHCRPGTHKIEIKITYIHTFYFLFSNYSKS